MQIDPLARGPRPALAALLTLGLLAGCVGPLKTPAPTTPAVSAPAAPISPPPAPAAPDAQACAPSAVQPAQGDPIFLLSRVAGCPGLVRVEWRGATLRVAADALLAGGLPADALAALPEEAR